MTSLPAPLYFVFRRFDGPPFCEFVFASASAGALTPGARPPADAPDSFVATLPKEQALALADKLSTETDGPGWTVGLAPRACPSCGRQVTPDDLDFCYPTHRRTQWRAGCNQHDFGCGFEVEAPVASADAIIGLWNSAQLFEYPAGDYARVEGQGLAALHSLLAKDTLGADAGRTGALDETQGGFSDEGMRRVQVFARNARHRLHFAALQYLRLLPRNAPADLAP